MDKKIPLIAVIGPTASGKTGLAVEIAKKYNDEKSAKFVNGVLSSVYKSKEQ